MYIRQGSTLAAIVAFGMISTTSTSAVFAEEVTASDSRGVNITVYNQNFGLVKDIREVELKDGINYLRFEDVAAQIDPTTVSFSSLTAPNSVVVREQNYQYDVMSPTTILNKSVGKPVKFRIYSNGVAHEESGTLLNSPQVSVSDTNGNVSTVYSGLVLKTPNGILLNPTGEAELAELPAGLVSKPSLFWKLEADKGGHHKTEICYQTAGLNWHCDYVAVINEDDTAADLTSWVTIDNQSGGTFKNANLKLLAGDVHKVQPMAPVPRGLVMHARAAAMESSQFEEQSFSEYHLYSLQGKTTVNDKETKQLSLFNANKIPVKKQFIFETGQSPSPGFYIQPDNTTANKVNVKLELVNSQANNLGMPMPKGKVRVYKRDKDGSLQFIGEDLIDHTPKDEKVRLFIGNAFDVVGERKQTKMEQASHSTKASYEITVRNHKESAITATIVEHAYGDWKVSNASDQFSKRDSHTFEFTEKIPANGSVTVTYDIETKF